MAVSYNKLWKLLIDKNMKKKELGEAAGISNTLIAKLGKNENVPKNEFPEIMHFVENLIMLTPNQHYGYAHPNNNTHIIDLAAQKVLLIAKTYSIRQNLTSDVEEHIFEFCKFLQVLSVGWDDENVLEIAENDYNDIIHAINYHYVA